MKTKIYPVVLYTIFSSLFFVSSCTASTPSQFPIPTLTISMETLRADPNYMAGCETVNPHDVTTTQASYRGMYPGRTTENEVENLLGKPLRTNDIHGISWEYDDLAVGFDGSIVSELFVTGDGVTTLKDLILEYGCPEAIYALDINEHPYGEYSRLLFLYHSIGFDFTIDNIPVKLNDKVYEMIYFIPGTPDDNMDLFKSLSVPNTSKPMTWKDAVH